MAQVAPEESEIPVEAAEDEEPFDKGLKKYRSVSRYALGIFSYK